MRLVRFYILNMYVAFFIFFFVRYLDMLYFAARLIHILLATKNILFWHFTYNIFDCMVYQFRPVLGIRSSLATFFAVAGPLVHWLYLPFSRSTLLLLLIGRSMSGHSIGNKKVRRKRRKKYIVKHLSHVFAFTVYIYEQNRGITIWIRFKFIGWNFAAFEFSKKRLYLCGLYAYTFSSVTQFYANE